MALIERFDTPDLAEAGILECLARKDKIMGFGHAVYRHSDPRSDIIKAWLPKLVSSEEDKRLFAVSERIEAVMRREKSLFPNADFYHAGAYHALGIPTPLFTPIFVLSRTSGWVAHVFEQRADNRIIRPNADYIGVEPQTWLSIEAR